MPTAWWNMASEGPASDGPASDGPASEGPASEGASIEAPVRRITGPLDSVTSSALRVGEVLRVDGVIWALRDATLIRIFDEGKAPPVDLTGAILLHSAPSIRKGEDGHYDPVSVGTTTSMRMDRFTRGCVEQLGARAIVGKGGLSRTSGESLQAAGAVYLSIVGGAASPETQQVDAIEETYFEDLLPECLWKLRVSNFGPLFVTMDSTGASAYEEVGRRTEERRAKAEQILGI